MSRVNKKTVCIIGPFPPPLHGQSAAVKSLADSPLLQDKYNIIKVDYAYKWSTCKYLTGLYKIAECWKMLRNLRKLISQYRIDIFYLTISSSNQGAFRDWLITKTISKELDHAKFIIHHHSGNFKSFYNAASNRCRSLVNYYLSKADRVIVLTPRLRQLFDGLISDDKIRVVSNGISSNDIIPDCVVNDKIESLAQRSDIHILYLSVMYRLKGFFELLQAAPLLLKAGINFDMTFAGVFRNTIDKRRFDEYVQKNDLTRNVVYKGLAIGAEKRELLSKGDIFVLPTSLEEGQPISILETMASGMAIITTDHGGIIDVVKDQINGIILPEASPRAIAEAVINLCNNRSSFVKICELNMRTANDMYLEEHYIQNMINVFDEVGDI